MLAVSDDYSDKDFDALRSRLIALAKSAFPDWTDFDVASFGNLLLEMYAFVGDVLTFYQDNLARESRLVTATQRRNVIALAKMLGYRLSGARPATAVAKFRLGRPASAPVTLPAGTVVRTQEVTDPIRLQLLEPVIFQPGTSEASGVLEHSKTQSQFFDAQGQADLAVPLDFGPYLDGSARVSTPQGNYSEVESFLNSGPNDLHLVVAVDQNDLATLRFGTSGSGLPPVGTISITYKTGGGAAGNVDGGRLVVLDGNFHDAAGRLVQLSVSNPLSASGGMDRQSVASARLLAPESLRVVTRTVAREDFEINARRVPGVARALMLTSNEDGTIGENAGILFIIPQGGGMPTRALKSLVQRMVTEVYPCPLTFQVATQDPVYRSIDVSSKVYLREGASAAGVGASIRASLAAWFQVSEYDGTPNPNVDFGFNIKDAGGAPIGEVAWSDVFNVIRDTPGVRKLGDAQHGLTLNGVSADVKLAVRDFPVLGAVSLQNGDTGEPL